MIHTSWRLKLFMVCNYLFLAVAALLCLFPLIHVLAISFSSSSASSAGLVTLWPVRFTTKSYEYVLANKEFLTALVVSFKRLFLGTFINMLLTILIAYPLSKESSRFKGRTVYVWIFVITMLFSGGLIPLYFMIKLTGISNSLWALILPSAVPVFNIIILLNFFRGLPKELEEASLIDGAGHVATLFKIFVPLSLPAIATLTLFSMVYHWNSWFDGLIFMDEVEKYPLQSYLQTVIIQRDFASITVQDLELLQLISDRSIKAAQIFIGALPILIAYPFLQRFFVKGVVLGSVKQ
ncbi:carbohydrate ABC transporter permease [Paenibacillus solisilvae]|uniref:Carbohydrate ABC transporter permease n=1 Tax=Paenibacillus solisilvae TaxID=2486751 RepID=A0ABW0WAA5_9BACL